MIVVDGTKISCRDWGVIRTSSNDEFCDRIAELHKDLKKIINKYKPNLVAVEDLFFYKNVKTAMKVGQARGVILLTAVQAKAPIVEFTPLQVKQAIASYGRAEKAQVQQMVKTLLCLDKIPKPDDAADALAIAICAANSLKYRSVVS